VSGDAIEASALHQWLTSGQEIALIDLREQACFGRRHILRAVNIPRSLFELNYRRLIPRKSTPVVLCDDGEGLTESIADLLRFAGWCNLYILKGGLNTWEAAGYPLFSGVNVPSKAFGEYVVTQFGTPHICADELAKLQKEGRNLCILDSRPFPEFHNMSIPGGLNMPGAELVHRVKSVVRDPETLIVVNCAGRTRSVIGAQSLINAGIPNKVVALENGTMGWILSGRNCATGRTEFAPPPDPAADRWAVGAAESVAHRFQVKQIDRATADSWRHEENRTTYLLDVRTREEFESGHIPGSYHAPGGQLVQATDEYIGVQNARIILVDDTGTRACMTASWLKQMGWCDVAVLKHGNINRNSESGPVHDPVHEIGLIPVGSVGLEDVQRMGADIPIIDVSNSLEHRKSHPAGARFVIRSRMMSDLRAILASRWIIFTAHDPRLAQLAAQDMTRAGIHRVKVLRGGTAAWQEAGGAMESGMKNPFSPEEDIFHKPYTLAFDKDAMQRYIDWEIALVPQVKQEGTVSWPHFDP
jgi:rhodanese-related sulfurtransferase